MSLRSAGLILLCVPGPALAGSVSGEVRHADPPQDPVASARMTLFTPSLSFFLEARTDAAGAYSFASISSGAYQLGCAARGLAYVEQTVVVGAGDLVQDFMPGPETHPGQWDIIGNTGDEFLDATDIGVLLPDGNIFYCHDTTDPILFNPLTGNFSLPSSSGTPSGCMNGTLLADGSVIFAGGQNGDDPGDFVLAVPWVKNFIPALNLWQQLQDLQHDPGRWYPGLTRLSDGSLLVMGGGTCCSAVRTDTAELFDLQTQTWSYTGSMLNPCEFPPSALLYNGKVLATWSPPQLYDPATGQWAATGAFNQPDRGWPGHSDHSIVVLSDGRVLAIGILGAPQNTVMGEMYNPVTQTWSLTSNPDLVRFQTEVVQLPDGRILVAGGETEQDPPPVADVLGIVKWCDLYDAASDSWRRVADMNWFREYHAVTLLVPDGRVLITGGTRIKFQVGPTSTDVEAWSPPYLFRGVRPQITSISTTAPQRGSSITLQIAPNTQLTSVVMLGAQSTTHWVDGGIPRRLVLPVQQAGTTVTTTLPSDPKVLPLGHYLLFAMVDDIPSDGVTLQVFEGVAGPVPALSPWGLAALTGLFVLAALYVLKARQPDLRPQPAAS